MRQRGEFRISIGTSSVLMIFVVALPDDLCGAVLDDRQCRRPADRKGGAGRGRLLRADAKAQEALGLAGRPSCRLRSRRRSARRSGGRFHFSDLEPETGDSGYPRGCIPPVRPKAGGDLLRSVGRLRHPLTEVDVSLAEGERRSKPRWPIFPCPPGKAPAFGGFPEPFKVQASERHRRPSYQLVSPRSGRKRIPVSGPVREGPDQGGGKYPRLPF